MNNNSAIHFNYQKNINLNNSKKLIKFLSKLLADHLINFYEINFIFCSDSQILEINRNFLQHDYYTDIITFDLSESSACLIAEIYISIDTVKSNSELFAIHFDDELYRVVFHGLLHLCGYNDKTVAEKELMRSKENYYLSLYKRFHVEQ